MLSNLACPLPKNIIYLGIFASRVISLKNSLDRFVGLSGKDRRALERLQAAPLVQRPARATLVAEGDDPEVVRLMQSGWACRYKNLPDGRHQTVGLFIPGDLDLSAYVVRPMDHSIGALTPVSYYAIPPHLLEDLVNERPRLGEALLWQELVTSSIQREWLLNLGRRSALERMAHFFVELVVRLGAAGHGSACECAFPLTQVDLADVTGITPVHCNRTLREMRQEGLVELRSKRLQIPDLRRLKQVAMYNSNYLHLDKESEHLHAAH